MTGVRHDQTSFSGKTSYPLRRSQPCLFDLKLMMKRCEPPALLPHLVNFVSGLHILHATPTVD